MEHRVSVYVLRTEGLFAAAPVVLDGRSHAPAPSHPALLNFLTPAERQRADGFHHSADRRAFLVAHALLRIAVADHLGVPPAGVAFDFTCERCGEQHGRPRLVGTPGGALVSVSLSRTAGAVAVAVLDLPEGSAARVGVDLEPVSAVAFDGFDRVALSPAEHRELDPGDMATRAALWVRKEAVAKALGTGLRRDPRDIPVTKTDDDPRVRWADVSVAPHLGASTTGDYAAAIAVAGTFDPAGEAVVCTVIRADDLVGLALIAAGPIGPGVTPSGSPPPRQGTTRSSPQRARGR